ncbi:glycosyltransferase [Amycolatopsis sp. FBCC-B4732]|uniref:glycosyltransferase family 4 protein n=1 Tax=Amycolatopsis sp. FBCC-B4732 TaxID=3079339 RepID=UPI001FF6955A|nr:glycosyltransferase [Amycolatopsis sp. FBCC-B4732]UOX92447.1 glycosyltransferase [Amycolatopsis sp. FBCC-B4732]
MSDRIPAGRAAKDSFLLICDEWSPTRGGITTFNRMLAIMLAKEGHPTRCLVRRASDRELEDAAARGVELVPAVVTPGGPELLLLPAAIAAAPPDVVVGHDLVSGPAAWTYAKHFFPGAKLVHIMHTPHAQNEPQKRPDAAWTRTEECERQTRRIAADADVVAAVGPLLARRLDGIVGDGFGGTNVVQLDPGMTVPEQHPLRRRNVPVNRTVAVLSRARHLRPKGLDIAAKAIKDVVVPAGTPVPELLIRGAEAGHCDEVRENFVKAYGIARDLLDVRPFTCDPEEVARDFRRAALCLMPSRVEGFGLVGLEAIGYGTPVLLSSKSGVAETLRSHLEVAAEPMIVPVKDDGRDVDRWKDAIQRVFADLPAAFAYVHDVRAKLGGILTWENTARTLIESVVAAGVPVQA